MTRGPLRVVDLEVRVGGRHLLSGVTFELDPGDALWVRGPSGSGKSTLLRTLVGLCAEGSGRGAALGDATLASEGYARWRRKLSYALPSSRLIGGSVGEVLEAPFRYASASTSFNAEEAMLHLDALGLSGAFERDPRTLSSGEAQRVSLLRSLLHGPSVALLDEPFTHLDEASYGQTLEWLSGWQRRGTALLVVSHRALPFPELDIARFRAEEPNA